MYILNVLTHIAYGPVSDKRLLTTDKYALSKSDDTLLFSVRKASDVVYIALQFQALLPDPLPPN